MMVDMHKKVYLEPKAHVYYDQRGIKHVSVTTLIESYKPKFDKKYWSEFKAKQRGVSPEVILKEWERTNKIACDRGSKIHDKLEMAIPSVQKVLQINNGKINEAKPWLIPPPIGRRDLRRFAFIRKNIPMLYSVIKHYVLQGYLVYAELPVGHPNYLLAGTIDLLVINPKTRRFIIIDYKTNKDPIRLKSGYYKKINGVRTNIFVEKDEKMYFPIQDLDNSKGIIYTLQLSIYAHILELWNCICDGLFIWHIPGNYDTAKPYTINYLQSHANKLIDYHFKEC